jgi:tetratricopeptide (TPR) repeat protein
MTTPAAVGTPTAGAPTAARSAESALARTPPAAPAAEGIRVLRGSTAAPVDPALADAYDHLQAGRIESAQRLYSQVASAEPRNVDALLGLAAVAQLGNQPEAATRLWLRVLEVEPRNAHAQAALIGQLGRADPVAAESQLKTLISREPSAFLYFTLGNLYADQNRWAQAQQAYFQAHHLQPGNADHAFNLAVGLERISQPRLAINYLRIAIRLAEAGARANFDLPSARKRAALLEATHGAP